VPPLGRLPAPDERAVGQDPAQVAPVDQRQDDDRDAPHLQDVVDRQQVRILEPGRHLGLAAEPRQPLGVGDEGRAEDLQGHFAAQASLPRPEDVAHPAATYPFPDLEARHPVPPDARTRPCGR
jgi:hypothetical protein